MRLADYTNVDVQIARTAQGGFGLVYMGPDRMYQGRWRALKTVRPEILARTPGVRASFIREALVWVGLWPHANLLHAYGVSEIDGQPYLVLDYAARGNLRSCLGRDLPLGQSLLWAQMVAAGLEALHTPDPSGFQLEPIVHRDLKPENILIQENGLAQITDFGMAKVFAVDTAAPSEIGGEDSDPTRSRSLSTPHGVGFGTPEYMAPEQWADAASAGPPADIYAFGIILSELLARRHALLDLDGRHGQVVWQRAHQSQAPRGLRDVKPELPEGLEALYERCLAKRPERRPDVREALRVLQDTSRALGQLPYHVPDIWPHTRDHEVSSWQNLAAVYAQFGFYEDALLRIERVLALDARHPNARLTYANILAEMGRTDEAMRAYDAALAVRAPDDRAGRNTIWFDRGTALGKARRYAEADMAFARGLEALPDAADVWSNRATNQMAWAVAEAEAGRTTDARTHLERGIEYVTRAMTLRPGDPHYPHLLAILRQVRDQLQRP